MPELKSRVAEISKEKMLLNELKQMGVVIVTIKNNRTNDGFVHSTLEVRIAVNLKLRYNFAIDQNTGALIGDGLATLSDSIAGGIHENPSQIASILCRRLRCDRV
jgi:hypothetical protein